MHSKQNLGEKDFKLKALTARELGGPFGNNDPISRVYYKNVDADPGWWMEAHINNGDYLRFSDQATLTPLDDTLAVQFGESSCGHDEDVSLRLMTYLPMNS